MSVIGKNIKARREELGMTQRELAAKMGYSNHTTITKIESGKNDLPQSKIAQFAKVLNTSPGQLLGWYDEPEEAGALAAEVLLQPEVYNLVQDFLSLDEADQAMVTALVSSLAAKAKKD